MGRVDESEGSKAIALKAIRGVFIERDARVVQELFAPDYIQHNPTIPNGRDAIVMQAEVPAHETKSKNAMFTS